MAFANHRPFLYLSVLAFLLLLTLHRSSCITVSGVHHGSSIPPKLSLLHRLSPASPLYDASASRLQQLQSAMHRSRDRAAAIFSKNRGAKLYSKRKNNTGGGGGYVSPLKSSMHGDYVATLSFGTPPQTFARLFADTGSTLTWLKCTTASSGPVHVFQSAASSTYHNLTCGDRACRELQRDTQPGKCEGPTCAFEYRYVDMSGESGVMAADTLRLRRVGGGTTDVSDVAFGCALRSQGIKGDGGVGLDRGPYSLITQLGPRIGGKFSYCLVPYSSNASSSFFFGPSAVIRGADVKHTPLLVPNTGRNAYYVDVRSLRVGGRRAALPESSFQVRDGAGGTILDTGTTFTLLTRPVYRALEVALERAVTYPELFLTSVLEGLPCYDVSGAGEGGPELPGLTFYFRGGASLEIPPENLFFYVQDGIVCLTVQASPRAIYDLSIIGNRAMQNFHFSFDLKRNRLRFARRNCTEVQ